MAGVNVALQATQDYGVDGQFEKVVIRNGRRICNGFGLPFQAKATVNWERANGHIAYHLEAKTFNDMGMREDDESTLLLILLCLPREQHAWHSVSHSSTVLSHCCYWHVIRNQQTSNAASKLILIPEDQLLTPEALHELLDVERQRRVGL